MKVQSQKTVEEIKRLASADELSLYSYVMDRAEEVSSAISNTISKAKVYDGGIVFVYGAQNSGKTIVACSLLDELSKDGLVVIPTQPNVSRPDVPKNKFYSRTGVVRKVRSFSDKNDIRSIFHKSDVVIIDEIHFVPFEIQSYLLKEIMAFVERGGWVVCIGVLLTSQGGEFLLPAVLKDRAVMVCEMTSTCQKCGNRGARFNQRLVGGRPTSSDDPELLVPSERVVYEPRCSDCYVKIG